MIVHDSWWSNGSARSTIIDYHEPFDQGLIHWFSLKALANKDTLLRTHCCRHKCFPVCPRATFVADTNFVSGTQKMFLILFRTFCVRNKCFPVCAAQEISWATMCPQQCVLVYHGLNIFHQINISSTCIC